jgi:hypothetical protein
MAKKFDREDEPNEFMEAPCRCDCGLWFDQSDGHRSNSKPNQLICGECAEGEEADEEKEDELYSFNNQLQDAYFTIRETGEEYRKKYPVEFRKMLEKEKPINGYLLPPLNPQP